MGMDNNINKEVDYRLIKKIISSYSGLEIMYKGKIYELYHGTYNSITKKSLTFISYIDCLRIVNEEKDIKNIITLEDIELVNENDIIKLINEAIIYRLENFNKDYFYYDLRDLNISKDKIKLMLEIDLKNHLNMNNEIKYEVKGDVKNE